MIILLIFFLFFFFFGGGGLSQAHLHTDLHVNNAVKMKALISKNEPIVSVISLPNYSSN